MADLFSKAGWNHLEGYNTLYLNGCVLWVEDEDGDIPATIDSWTNYGQLENAWLTYFDQD